MLNAVDDRLLKIGLGVAGFLGESEEFEHVGFFENILRLGDNLAVGGELAYAVLVAAQGQALV